MSDYISELRRDLVEAAEREPHRGRAGRVARPLHPRAWSPTALAGAAAVAVALVAVVVTLTTLAPPPKPSDAKIVATVHLGGQPRDAVLAGGSLWIADFEGRVLRLDPATHRVRARIRVGGTPRSIAAGGGAVWVMSNDDGRGRSSSHLFKLDARSGQGPRARAGQRLRQADRRRCGRSLAVYGRRTAATSSASTRDSYQRTAFIPSDTGTLGPGRERARRCGRAGRAACSRSIAVSGASSTACDGITSLGSRTEHACRCSPTATASGSTGRPDGWLCRVEGGRVTRRIAVGEHGGRLAETGSAIWVSAGARAARQDAQRGGARRPRRRQGGPADRLRLPTCRRRSCRSARTCG